MTLANKPLEELQALRDEVEAAIAAKADPLAVAVGDAFDRLPGCWNRETFTASVCGTLRAHGMELQRLAPAEPVEALAQNFRDMLEAHCDNIGEPLCVEDQALFDGWKAELAALRAQAPAEIGEK